jgi:hypothetical protein
MLNCVNSRSRGLNANGDTRWFTCHLTLGKSNVRGFACWHSKLGRECPTQHIASPGPHRGTTDRTERLTTPHLVKRVNTGSPKRAALHSPAWRRSRHISQTLRVMPETVIPIHQLPTHFSSGPVNQGAEGWTGMTETDRATGRGKSAIRVKGGAFAKISGFRATEEVR